MKFEIIRKNIYMLLFFTPTAFSVNKNSCIHEAAQCFKINPLIIKAIILQESSNRQHIINVNKNKTIDVGIMQINSIHFNELKLKGISEQDLRDNSCTNIFSGTWILSRLIQNNGYTWEEIGKYHSKTPSYRDRYTLRLINIILNNNHELNKIDIPYQEGIRNKFPCN